MFPFSQRQSESLQSVVDDALKFDLRSIFELSVPLAGMPDEGEDNEGEEGEDGGKKDDDGSADDEGKDKSGAKGKTEAIKDPKLKKVSDEAAAARVALKTANKELDDLRKFKKEAEDANKSEVEKLSGERDELTKQVETLTASVEKLSIENEFVLNHASKFSDADVARRFLRDEIGKTINVKDGAVEGLSEAVEALLKEKPKWAKSDEDDEDEDEPKAPSGRQHAGRKNGKATETRAALAKKFPALNR